jgi:hypothetical protein
MKKLYNFNPLEVITYLTYFPNEKYNAVFIKDGNVSNTSEATICRNCIDSIIVSIKSHCICRDFDKVVITTFDNSELIELFYDYDHYIKDTDCMYVKIKLI